MKNSRLKIIPNTVFSKLWNVANTDISLGDYISAFSKTDGKYYKVFMQLSTKAGLDYVESIELLQRIYKLSRISFSEILDLSQKTTTQISAAFCIPIRTVEDWHSEKNRCNAYIRLMLLRQLHLFELGKYIRVESEMEYFATMPRIYNERRPAKEDTPVGAYKRNGRGMVDNYDDYIGTDPFISTISTERSDKEKAFFARYGFYPERGVNY